MATMLEEGDVIEMDASWRVRKYEPDRNLVTIDQERQKVPGVEYLYQSVDYGGPYFGAPYEDTEAEIKAKLKAANITLNVGDAFLVVSRKMTDDSRYNDLYPSAPDITAVKLQPGHVYDPAAVRVHFFQSRNFNCAILEPKVTGRMTKRVTVTFDPFKPTGPR